MSDSFVHKYSIMYPNFNRGIPILNTLKSQSMIYSEIKFDIDDILLKLMHEKEHIQI